jgi:phage terminase large subunit GpA-like protein
MQWQINGGNMELEVELPYESQVIELLFAAKHELSSLKPSVWAEQHRVMSTENSPFPGKFSYDISPYLREIIDCLASDHPAHTIAVKKGAQVGFSTGVIENGVGWIISECPSNILFLTGHSDLSEEAMLKIDSVIDSCGLRPLIRPNVLRAKNMRTGDTNKSKEFPGGSLVAGSAGNHKLLRQRSVRFGFIDDFDAAKMQTKESGSTTKMIEQRFAAYADKRKLFYISTPELKATSNIEPVYLLGDQRRYFVPCPCCHALITLEWNTDFKNGIDSKERAGITWKTDNQNKLIEESVGYVCQECAGFFNDADKHRMNLDGSWKPTAEPSQLGYYSYHLSSLYAPVGMYDWKHYVRQYLEANPPEGKQIEHLQKTFVNLCLGETFEQLAESPKANDLQKNIRPYEIGTIPEKLSIQDGNGKIVLLTCVCDLNGVPDDARLDYEVVAWAESGVTYSIDHGSIGTFIPREGAMKHKVDRERWSYDNSKVNNVWKDFDKVLSTVFLTDTGRKMKVFIAGVDTGQYNVYAYPYVDNANFNMIALKGKDKDKYIPFGKDLKSFRIGKERANLFLVEVGFVKDQIAEQMKLRWDERNDDTQPVGFMNFPTPSGGKYLFKNFFSHYESEHRVIESKDGEPISAIWKKKSTNGQNHFFDVRVYHIATKDILMDMIFKSMQIKNGTWVDFVNILLGNPI